MPDTGSEDAHLVVERLICSNSDTPIAVSHDVKRVEITVSAGVAVIDAAEDTAEDLIQCADDALYAAKRGGCNRMVMAG